MVHESDEIYQIFLQSRKNMSRMILNDMCMDLRGNACHEPLTWHNWRSFRLRVFIIFIDLCVIWFSSIPWMGISTTSIREDSHPSQLVPKVTHTQDNSYPWQLISYRLTITEHEQIMARQWMPKAYENHTISERWPTETGRILALKSRPNWTSR